MKISIGYNIIDGPWGGGNSFAKQLKNFLELNGYEVLNNLKQDNIDIILLTEPRKHTQSSSFNHVDVKRYLTQNQNSIVISRINECDERKKSKGLNNFLINTAYFSDHTVFISNWLKELFIDQGFNSKNSSVILNGADEKMFFPKINKIINEKIKIVTHHWGNNVNKGAEAYLHLDKLLNNKEFNEKFEFYYICNLPKNIKFKNTYVLPTMFGKELAETLRNCDIYITGSLFEPAGMHHIEAALSGLPVLYIKSGGIPEYTKDIGVEFKIENLDDKLINIYNNLEIFKTKLLNYQFTGSKMCDEYLNLFINLVDNKNEIIKQRKLRQNKRMMKEFKIFKKYIYL